MAKLMAEASPINPEIQAMAPAMQPADGLIKPLWSYWNRTCKYVQSWQYDGRLTAG